MRFFFEEPLWYMQHTEVHGRLSNLILYPSIDRKALFARQVVA